MPHKRAKRSVRDKESFSRKSDLPPSQSVSGFQNDGGFPKSAAWVLNAEAVRSAYREKRKRDKDEGGGEENGKRQRKRKSEDGHGDVDARRANANLTIKPGESLKHFNRRVEDDMRPLVRTAMSSTASSSRQKRKTAEKDGQSNISSEMSSPAKLSRLAQPKTHSRAASSAAPLHEPKDFDRLISSAPKRLNDIAQAPPQLSIRSRLKRLESKGASVSSGGKSDNVVSAAQKRMMDLEREKAIARYRALKSNKQLST